VGEQPNICVAFVDPLVEVHGMVPLFFNWSHLPHGI
jgi:hypothetical protein